jgi:hypothetical protein
MADFACQALLGNDGDYENTFGLMILYLLLPWVCDKNVGRLDRWFYLSYNLNAY